MEKDKYVREMKRYFLDVDTGERAGREILEHLEDKQEYYVQMGFSFLYLKSGWGHRNCIPSGQKKEP